MSRLHSEILLAQAASEAASLSISETTSSDGTTVYGLGATTGRGILAVGSFALRRIDEGIIVFKLFSIRQHLRSKEDVSPDIVADLLEYQRIKAYPKPITRYAWSLIGVLLKRGQVEHFTKALSEWYPHEIRLFLRQLVAYRFSGWDKHHDIRHFMAVASSIKTIVLSLLEKDPLFLQGIFNASDFATFLIPGVHQDHTPEFALSAFFQHLCANYADEGKRTTIITDMVSYLRTEKSDQLLSVVDYIMKMMRSMVSNHEIQTSRDRMRHNISGALPYLSFALHLVTVSDVASKLFFDREAFQVVEDFCIFGFPNASCNHYQTAVSANVHVRWMAYAICCEFLAHLYRETDWTTNFDRSYNATLLELFSPSIPPGDIGMPFHESAVASDCLNNARTWNFIFHSLTSSEDVSFLSLIVRSMSDNLAIRFLRDLGAYKNYAWCRNAGILSALTDYYAFHQEMLDSRLRDLLQDLIPDKHQLLVEAYGLTGFLRILIDSEYLKQRRTRNNPSSSLSLFIGYVIHACQQTNEWDPPDTIVPLLELVQYVDISVIRPLLGRVMDGLQFFTCRQIDLRSLPQLSGEYTHLQPESHIHPAYPFVMLTHQLCLVSPLIAVSLCKDGLVATLESMWLTRCGQMDKMYTNDGHGAWLGIHVGIILILSTLLRTHGCEGYILRSPFLQWFLADDVHVATLRRYANDENVQWLILHSTQSTLLLRKDACAGVWRALIGIPLRRDGRLRLTYQQRIDICLEDHIACLVVALSCSQEYRWKGLLEGMKQSHEKQLRHFLVDSLRFLYDLRQSRELRQLLMTKLDEMQTFGILSSSESMNPVETFMKLLATGVLGKYISPYALPTIDISNMLDDISNGQFNLLQRGGRPTALQHEAYATTSQALRHELDMFSMVKDKNRHH